MTPVNLCSTCPHFATLSTECRVDSPRVFPMQGPNGQIQMIGVWPPTRESNWCGKHPHNVQ